MMRAQGWFCDKGFRRREKERKTKQNKASGKEKKGMKESKKREHAAVRKLFMLMAAFAMILCMKTTANAAGVLDVDMQKNNQAYVYTGVLEDYETTVYHRIVIKKAGALVIAGNSIEEDGSRYGLSFSLCDRNKRLLEPYQSTYVSTGEYATYGVRPGTYYIRVKNEKYYVLSAALQKFADKGGTSKKNATKIAHKKKITGVLAAGEKGKKADWFKLVVPKDKKLQIELDTAGNDSIAFYMYGPSYPKGVYIDSLMNKSGKYYSVRTSGLTEKKSKVKKGTYYIKVIRSSKKKTASGVYSIRWIMK